MAKTYCAEHEFTSYAGECYYCKQDRERAIAFATPTEQKDRMIADLESRLRTAEEQAREKDRVIQGVRERLAHCVGLIGDNPRAIERGTKFPDWLANMILARLVDANGSAVLPDWNPIGAEAADKIERLQSAISAAEHTLLWLRLRRRFRKENERLREELRDYEPNDTATGGASVDCK